MSSAATALVGEVVKVTFRRLRSGDVRHWTRIEFEQPSPFKSVALSGVIPAEFDPEIRLLESLRERYDVVGLPEARWSE